MEVELRKKIAYWFFLITGMAGVAFQLYEFFTGHIDFNINQIGVTALFSVFIFKPNILVDLFEKIRGLTK